MGFCCFGGKEDNQKDVVTEKTPLRTDKANAYSSDAVKTSSSPDSIKASAEEPVASSSHEPAVSSSPFAQEVASAAPVDSSAPMETLTPIPVVEVDVPIAEALTLPIAPVVTRVSQSPSASPREDPVAAGKMIVVDVPAPGSPIRGGKATAYQGGERVEWVWAPAADEPKDEFEETRGAVKTAALQNDCIAWIENVLHGKYNKGDDTVWKWLASGHVLCMVLNEIAPGTVKKINLPNGGPDAQKGPRDMFRQAENITSFIKGCRAFGVNEKDCFNTEELLNCTRGMHDAIFNTIYMLGSAVQTSQPGYAGPKLGQVIKAQLKNTERRNTMEKMLFDQNGAPITV